MNRKRIQSLAWCLGIAMGLAALAARAETPAADAEGFRPLFDGKTLEGWDGDPKIWRVEDGCITGQTTKENPAPYNTFLIWRGGKPGDFQLKIEFRMPNPGFANSGVQIRSWEEQPQRNGKSSAISPTWIPTTTTRALAMARVSAAAWPAAARRC